MPRRLFHRWLESKKLLASLLSIDKGVEGRGLSQSDEAACSHADATNLRPRRFLRSTACVRRRPRAVGEVDAAAGSFLRRRCWWPQTRAALAVAHTVQRDVVGRAVAVRVVGLRTAAVDSVVAHTVVARIVVAHTALARFADDSRAAPIAADTFVDSKAEAWSAVYAAVRSAVRGCVRDAVHDRAPAAVLAAVLAAVYAAPRCRVIDDPEFHRPPRCEFAGACCATGRHAPTK
mmetsp:Transcript_13685/g.29525  ORF Transcript_13685/g.29525 Transcript_13685/m.29525 type:complete len:233 (-) Transcript_13685:417-1115(-)|eukprot:668691-Pleurochrysis_carterae.AAC.5